MHLSANGRVVLITGGSQGLGLATAIAYRRAGADVAILARSDGPLEAARQQLAACGPGRSLAVRCDVSSADGIVRAHQQVVGELGDVDIVINNAGKAHTKPVQSITDSDWQSDFDLKLFAAIRLTRLVWPGMQKKRWGRIINVLNTFAKAPGANTAPTSVTRAAGMALTKVMAAEGAAHNILVNALLVGLIESEQTHRWHAANAPGTPYEQFVTEFGARIPLGRIGKPEEFAGTALFLGSEAAGYLTGTAINIDGGSCPVV